MIVKVVLSKVSIVTILVTLESLLNLLLDNAKISIFSKVDKMYLLLYLVTYLHIKLAVQLL